MADGQVVAPVTVDITIPAITAFMPAVPPQWASGVNYNVDDVVTHEAISYIALVDHLSDGTNEPNAVADLDWQMFWTQTSVSWGDYLFRRTPPWMQQLDALKGNPLRRFLRIFGRELDKTGQDGLNFPLLKDPLFTPAAFLEDFGLMFGLVLPTPLAIERQRQLLLSIVEFYKAKGTINSLEFIVARYTGSPSVIISAEDHGADTYTMDVQYPIGSTGPEQLTFADEVERIVLLFEPAGLTHTINFFV
ncbi:hypothetical protein LCGC14_2687040 [marine sediment metagenome]|uniref:Uncharacterized protein n=1 Tax=marine sediment metagenome TaxID=412755 RepID=A0A0F9A746_9ZZZZ